MKVSVIIPTFNSEKFISEALDSVYRQTFHVQEVICVDDSSSDGTVELIRSAYPHVVVLENSRNEGPAYCRNQGISIATGNVIALLDSDDYWVDEKTAWQISALQNDPTLGIVGGLTEYFFMADSAHRKESALKDKPHYNAYLQAFLIRIEVFQKIGLLNPALRLSEDQDWLLRAREAGIKMKIINKTLTKKRVHDGNITKSLTFRESGMIDVIKMSLDRRRKSDVLHDLNSIAPE